jgi:tetratricopeptide (TPR) repeat protein
MQDNIIEALRSNAADDAVALARQWVQTEPTQAQAWRWLSLSLQQQGQHEEAAQSIAQALELAPDDANLHLQQAGLLLAQRQLEAAGQALEKSTTLNPNEFSAYVMQAHLALARNDVDEAERLGRLAARVEPDHVDLAPIEGMVALHRGDVDRALALLSAASQQRPDDARLLYALGFAYMGKDMLAFAEQAFRRVVELTPDNRALRGLVVQLALRQGHVDAAAEMMRQVLALPEGDSPAMRRLAAELELQSGQPLQALEYLRPLLAELPGDRGTVQLALMAWERLGRDDEARQTLDGLLEAHPQSHDLWMARLAIAPVGGPEAVTVVERWLQAMPEYMPALETRMRLHDMNQEPDAAEAVAHRIIALEPGRASGEQRIVEALLQRDPAAAAAHVQQLIDKADPTALPGLRTWLGAVQDRGGNPAGAVATWLALHTEQAPQRLPLPPQAKAPVEWPALAEVTAENPVRPILVWGAPGSGVERVVMAMSTVSTVVRTDRFGATPPDDGFQNYLTLPRLASGELSAEAMVQQWRQALPARGIGDGNVVDWLLWWDNALLWALRPALPEGRLLTVVRDPRDMLIEWLALGAPAPFAVTSVSEAAQWLKRSLEQIATLHEQELYPHLIMRVDDVVNSPQHMAQLLEQAFGVRVAPLRTLGPTTIEGGHWRKYSEVLSSAFALLTPVAVRLGYPEV